MPSGVTLTDNDDGTATLSGNPATGTYGTYPFTITAANSTLPDATQSFTLTVNQAPAITSANTTTFTVGQAGSFTITTTGNPTAGITETGSLPAGVTFTDNANGTATLAGTPQAGTGSAYSLTFTAANGVSPNATQGFTLTVNEAPAITSADHTGFAVGQTGSFTITTTGFPAAAISETGALPSGVTLTDNDDGTATLSGNPATGSHGTYAFTITAANGTLPDAGQNFTLTVQAATTTTLIASPNPSVFGQTVTFVAQVANTSGTGPVPDGQVQFYDGTTEIGGEVPLDANGTATLSTSDLLPSIQAHSIMAQYVGNDNFQPSTSATQSEIVNKAGTTTILVASANLSVYGQDVTFTAFVAAVSPGSGTPTGTVNFDDNGTPIGTGTLSSGVATFTTSTLTASGSPYSITAVYSGDPNFTTSTSSAVSQVVDKASTTTGLALTSGTNPSVSGQSVTFTATVAAVSPGSGTPTGTVNFLDGTTTIGTDIALNSSGVATFSTSTPTASGSPYSITAVYSGDPNFTTSTSSAVSQVVDQASTTTGLASPPVPTPAYPVSR